MLCKMEKDIKILPSLCDNTSHMSIPSIFSLFMDLASEHAPLIGLGSDTLAEKGLFWVASKTKINIPKRPKMMDELQALTWPEAPQRARCMRYYSLTKNNELMASGKTEWAIIELETGRPHRISEIYPDGLEHLPDVVCNEPFAKIFDNFDGCEILGKYVVKSTDIDLGQHMNNAAYIRALFGLFSCSELEKMNISDVEINFRTPCYEDDELTVYSRKTNDTLEIGMIRNDGKVAATVRIF